jgi:hypothetical protein
MIRIWHAVFLVLSFVLLSFSATYYVMEKRVEHAKVESFNDGFLDGACHDGEDGFGVPCKN